MFSNSNLAIYIHWPFCKSKCPYCDFNSHVRDNVDNRIWLNAYLSEIDNFSYYIIGKNITSIFFGGGTPSLMPPLIVQKIIDKLSSIANLSKDIEITLEANPTSIETDNFKSLANAGVNRISIGVQSFDEKALKFLGRNHSKGESIEAIELAANIFDNYSFDLIYTLPNQTLNIWEDELRFALKFVSNHLSLYQLTIEKGTAFYTRYKAGEFSMIDNDKSADFYKLTQDIMNIHDMPAYEVSNHAKSGFESKHNLAYWNYLNYLGIGPGAHSRINGRSMTMIYNPEKWQSLIKSKETIQQQENLNIKQQIDEIFMMGLRLNDGVNLSSIEQRFNININGYVNNRKIIEFREIGLLTLYSNQLKLTDNGILLINKILEEILLM